MLKPTQAFVKITNGGKMELPCKFCSFHTSKLQNSKAKQRMAANIFSKHNKLIELTNNCDEGSPEMPGEVSPGDLDRRIQADSSSSPMSTTKDLEKFVVQTDAGGSPSPSVPTIDGFLDRKVQADSSSPSVVLIPTTCGFQADSSSHLPSFSLDDKEIN